MPTKRKEPAIRTIGDVDYVTQDYFANHDNKLVVHAREHTTLTARLAIDLAARWGVVAAQDGGEDSAGRHQYMLSEPSAVIDRAVAMAEGLVAKLKANGHILPVPSFTEMIALPDDEPDDTAND